MKYVIYCGHTDSGDVINMTHNINIDYAFLNKTGELYSIEILTPDINISQADYVMRYINRENGARGFSFLRGGRKGSSLKYELIKRALSELGIKPLKKSWAVREAELTCIGSGEAVYSILRGRIMSCGQMICIVNKDNLFVDGNMYDILHSLYLEKKVRLFPSILIDRPGRKYICMYCENELPGELLDGYSRCPCCGNYVDFDEPLFACGAEENRKRCVHVKYKCDRKLTLYQDRASLELASFLNEDGHECLLWTAPGTEDMHIASRTIREVLNRGGRVLIGFPSRDEALESFLLLKETFPGAKVVFDDGPSGADMGNIVICQFENIKRYYETFELAILNGLPDDEDCLGPHLRRAIRQDGRVIYETSTPDYNTYSRAVRGDIKLITVPLRGNGKPSAEPRILTYKAMSPENFFIPGEVADFLVWSLREKMRTCILVPSCGLVDMLKNELLSIDGIDEQCLLGTEPMILIVPFSYGHIYDGMENVILFFADQREIFDEKSLLYGAGICENGGPGEVIFVGSKESDEMYNVKLMLRFMNKTAWEMGYLK